MSDSFADLWNSSTPQTKPQTLSSLAQQQSTQQQQQRNRPQGGQDLFALLSSTSSTSNAARSSPSLRSCTPSSNTSTPPPPPSIQQQQRQQQSQAQRSTGDAFSDLFLSSSSSNQNLTIAQRSALADKQRKEAIMERQKQQEKEKSAWAGLDSLGIGGGGPTGSGLTPTTTTSAVTSKPASSAQKSVVDHDDDWGLGDFVSKPSKITMTAPSSQDKPSSKPTATATDEWDFDNLGAPQGKYTATTAATKSGSGELWDLDEFSSASTTATAEPRAQRSRIDSPSNDFDFGTHDGLLNGDDNGGGEGGDDDFMSVFNKPQPKETKPSHQRPSSPSPSSSPGLPSSQSHAQSRSQNQARGSSPPPHILGQIIEMGFSIPKAKAALAANNNDVQAALDQLLVSEGGYAGNSGAGGRGTPIRGTGTGSPAPNNGQTPRRRRDRDRDPQLADRQQRRGDTSSPSSSMGGGTGDIQAQAEQILAQASEIGRGMFTKASAFWKEKKEQVQKVVEEHRTTSAASGSGSGSERAGGGRPKWMQEQPGDDDEVMSPKSAFRDEVVSPKSAFRDDQGGFRDGVGGPSPSTGGRRRKEPEEPEVWIPKRPDRQRQRERERAREREREAAAAAAAISTPPPVEEPEVDLFTSASASTSTPALLSRPRQQPAPSRSRPHPPKQQQRQTAKFQRNTSPIQSQIASLKLEANASFKLGQFGQAEQLYTRAIDSLRQSSSSTGGDSMYFVLLLNNRANARMKNGDISGAVKDCDGVVGLVSTNRLGLDDGFDSLGGASSTANVTGEVDWDPSFDLSNTKLPVPISSSSGDIPQEEMIDLIESLTKAIKRRAEGYEGLEKWSRAKKDWEYLRGCGWIGAGARGENVRGEAGRGVGRCERMLGGGSSGSGMNGASSTSRGAPAPASATATKPKPRTRPPPAPAVNSGAALNNLRTTTAQAEAEDQAKHNLKDTIDTKLANWKNGKESNIRALLASLDMILWDELLNSGAKVKVGMHELVAPAQVKIKYMKAVAKVHPDKLNASNSTLEQRMIAQGVFGALNEAWNAFKQ